NCQDTSTQTSAFHADVPSSRTDGSPADAYQSLHQLQDLPGPPHALSSLYPVLFIIPPPYAERPSRYPPLLWLVPHPLLPSLHHRHQPENESYAVDVYDEETVKADVERAKEEADIVMVFLHTGVEYQNEPDEATKERVEYLADLGVDVVIGTHPHVIR